MAEANGIKALASGRYQARYRFAPGPRGIRSASFDSRREAKTWLLTQAAASRNGTAIDPRHGRLLVGEYFAGWLERQWHHAAGTRRAYRWRWDALLASTFDRVSMGELTPAMVQRWQARELRSYDPGTVADAQGLLSQVLAAAVADRLLAVNPTSGIAAPRRRRRTVTEPEVDTVRRLFDHAPPHFVIALHLGLNAGLRAGEIRGLSVDRVDFGRRLLTIDRQLLLHPPDHVFDEGEWHHGREAFSPTKGGRAGDVPIGPTLLNALETHLRLRRPGVHGLVVTARQGGPMGRGSWEHEWRRLRAAAGVPVEWGAAHQLRHAYASWMLADGEPLANVSRNLRHATPSITLDMYVHPDKPRVEREPSDRFAWAARGPSAAGL